MCTSTISCGTTRQRHKSSAPAVVMHNKHSKANSPRSSMRMRPCAGRRGATARINEPPTPSQSATLGAPESVKPNMPRPTAMPLFTRQRGKVDRPTKISDAKHSWLSAGVASCANRGQAQAGEQGQQAAVGQGAGVITWLGLAAKSKSHRLRSRVTGEGRKRRTKWRPASGPTCPQRAAVRTHLPSPEAPKR